MRVITLFLASLAIICLSFAHQPQAEEGMYPLTGVEAMPLRALKNAGLRHAAANDKCVQPLREPGRRAGES